MRYGSDYGMERGWGRGAMDRSTSGGRGGYGTDSRRVFTAGGGRVRDETGSRDYGPRGMGRGGTYGPDRGADRYDRDFGRAHHRFFGRWTNEGEDGTWESDRHGVGRYAADRGYGRDYRGDYDAGVRRFRRMGPPTGRPARGYDRGW